MSATEQIAAPPADFDATGENPDTGRIFGVPRVAVVVDEADPNVIKLKFGGQIELDRAKPDDVAFFNSLQAGKNFDLPVSGHVAGSKKTHRHDSEGNVDAVVESKSLVISNVTVTD
jgi:hypothetical protein